MSHRPLALLSSLAFTLLPTPAPAAPTFYGPTPYLSPSDSPLPSPIIETLEDGALNLPGLSASSGVVLSPNPLTDSVDADDGAIDNSGAAGHSLLTTQPFITITFDPLILGSYPTHAGLVWTDVGANSPLFGAANVSFEAFAPGGASLGSIGPFLLGDGSVGGATAEDRFFGVSDPAGIASITISVPSSNDWEIDHIQFVIPEPSLLTLLLITPTALLPRRRR